MNRPPRTIVSIIIAIVAAPTTMRYTDSLLLLSDLPTPSFIIDTQALLRRHVTAAAAIPTDDGAMVMPSFTSVLPSIHCPKTDLLLRPSMISGQRSLTTTAATSPSTTIEATQHNTSECTISCEFEVIEGKPAVGYIHSSVIRAREDVLLGMDDPISTFLAELDVDCNLCGDDGARLVLGLNNHHVGSYYWARSAGGGSSMEAPGVIFGSSGGSQSAGSRGILRWINEGGPEACNSNDGKRSEWVNFLRRGDTVQLVPMDGQDSILQFSSRFGKLESSTFAGVNHDDDHTFEQREDFAARHRSSIRVFGVSSQGRPMGSEPEVVCEWTVA
ncbi:hypothetical protein ACHAXH_003758 [Discostella pseudostelligera]